MPSTGALVLRFGPTYVNLHYTTATTPFRNQSTHWSNLGAEWLEFSFMSASLPWIQGSEGRPTPTTTQKVRRGQR